MNKLATEFSQPRLATTLWTSFAELFDVEVLVGDDEQRWDPQTVQIELTQTAGKLLPANFDKLMAAAELVGTDHFEQSLPDFIRICNILNDSPTDGSFDPAEAHEIGWAILESGVLTGRRPTLNLEIQGYIERVLHDAGLTLLPSPFDIVISAREFAWDGSARTTDDAELFELGQAAEDEHAAQIGLYIRTRFQRLLHELSELPLASRQPDWRQGLLSDLREILTNENQSSQGKMA